MSDRAIFRRALVPSDPKAESSSPVLRFSEISAVLGTPHRLNRLHNVLRSHRQLLSDTIDLTIYLSHFQNAVLLVDFDVLQCYLEDDTAPGLAKIDASSWFHSTQVPFALPAGSYYELCTYLGINQRSRIAQFAAKHQKLDALEALRALALHLGVHVSRQEEDKQYIADQLLPVLERKSSALRKLVTFLTHKNFRGVVSPTNRDIYALVKKAIAIIPDHRRDMKRNRPRLDHNDALNLSIVLNAVQESRSVPVDEDVAPPSLTSYVLMTNTMLLRNLPVLLKTHQDPSSQEDALTVKQFGQLIDRPDIDNDRPHTGSSYPVINPALAQQLEIFGSFEDPVPAQNRQHDLRDQLRELDSNLERLIPRVNKHRAENAAAAFTWPDDLQQSFMTVAKGLISVASVYKPTGVPLLLEAETFRADSIVLSDMLARAIDPKSVAIEQMELASTDFLHLLTQVYHILSKTEGIGYKTVAASNKEFGIVNFQVFPEPLDIDGCPVLEGTKWLPSGDSANSSPFCELRWKTFATEYEIVHSINRVFLRYELEAQTPTQPVSLRPATTDSANPQIPNTIIVEDGAYDPWAIQISPAVIARLASPEALCDLVREIQLQSKNRQQGGVTIRRYVFVLPGLDVGFDIWPGAATKDRYVVVRSQRRRIKEIAQLIDLTSTFHVVEAPLCSELEAQLAEFDD